MEDKTAEEIKRHFDVVAESLKDEIKLVAEGHSILDRKMDGLDRKVDKLRKENAEEHREILSAIKFSYAELNHRIVTLENKFTDVEKRVNRLEALR